MVQLDVQWLQIPATVLSLGYTWLAARQSISAWPVALAGSCIFILISVQTDLVQDAVLHVFYGITAIWGWLHWRKTATSNKINSISAAKLWGGLWITALPALGSFWVLSQLQIGHLPLADAFTTWYSFLGTAWIIFRIRQAWLLFIVIDLVQAWMYFTLHLYVLVLLYLGYTLLAAYAYHAWGAKMPLKTLKNE